jgi:hypothetical protein
LQLSQQLDQEQQSQEDPTNTPLASPQEDPTNICSKDALKRIWSKERSIAARLFGRCIANSTRSSRPITRNQSIVTDTKQQQCRFLFTPGAATSHDGSMSKMQCEKYTNVC